MRLFEFGDLNCMPDWYHIYLRKYLTFFYRVFGYYKLWVPDFANFIKKIKKQKLMECCSGSGDALVLIDSQLDKKEFDTINYILSDIRPNPEFYTRFNITPNGRFNYIEDPVDITQETTKYDYPKIFINSFHHFSRDQAKKILDVNLSRKNEIIILEYVRKSFLGFLSMPIGPIVIILTLPFVVKLKHLPVMAFFTYFLPVFPIMMLWDGIVSCLHEYNEDDLQKIIAETGHQVTLKSCVNRNILYPAGVSVISFTYDN